MPHVTLDDHADAALFSSLSYEQAKALKHPDVVCAVSGSEVRRWKVREFTADDTSQTFAVRLHEWPKLVFSVKANRLHKHSANVPSV